MHFKKINFILIILLFYQSPLYSKSNSFDDFNSNASSDEMVGLLKGINTVAKKLQISVDTGRGYRALTNISEHGGQEVPHLHFHLFGGERVGKMVE